MKSAAVILLINYCFYRKHLACIFLLPVAVFYYRLEKSELLHRKRQEARQQFKELLLLTVAGQKAGYSVENAFFKSYKDMENLFGRRSSICRMLIQLRAGLENHVSPGLIWREIGEMSDIAEIIEFSQVFSIAKESGGNMTVIMERTAGTIESKTETQQDIETLLSARRLEQKIMNAMPFLLMLYMNITSPGYFDGLYQTSAGMGIMTFCLVIYLAAYLLSVKLIKIKV